MADEDDNTVPRIIMNACKDFFRDYWSTATVAGLAFGVDISYQFITQFYKRYMLVSRICSPKTFLCSDSVTTSQATRPSEKEGTLDSEAEPARPEIFNEDRRTERRRLLGLIRRRDVYSILTSDLGRGGSTMMRQLAANHSGICYISFASASTLEDAGYILQREFGLVKVGETRRRDGGIFSFLFQTFFRRMAVNVDHDDNEDDNDASEVRMWGNTLDKIESLMETAKKRGLINDNDPDAPCPKYQQCAPAVIICDHLDGLESNVITRLQKWAVRASVSEGRFNIVFVVNDPLIFFTNPSLKDAASMIHMRPPTLTAVVDLLKALVCNKTQKILKKILMELYNCDCKTASEHLASLFVNLVHTYTSVNIAMIKTLSHFLSLSTNTLLSSGTLSNMDSTTTADVAAAEYLREDDEENRDKFNGTLLQSILIDVRMHCIRHFLSARKALSLYHIYPVAQNLAIAGCEEETADIVNAARLGIFRLCVALYQKEQEHLHVSNQATPPHPALSSLVSQHNSACLTFDDVFQQIPAHVFDILCRPPYTALHPFAVQFNTVTWRFPTARVAMHWVLCSRNRAETFNVMETEINNSTDDLDVTTKLDRLMSSCESVWVLS